MEFEALYGALDQAVDEVRQRTGVHCAPGCGLCCRRPSRSIEAAPVELGTLARQLWDAGRGAEVLEAARKAGAEGPCVLYSQGEGASGRCTAYAHRPLTCRLFGFAAFLDREGRPRPLFSAAMKEADPGAEGRFDAAVDQGFRPPLAAEWRRRQSEADPRVLDLEPLNLALARALEREGLVRRLADQAEGPSTPSGPEAAVRR